MSEYHFHLDVAVIEHIKYLKKANYRKYISTCYAAFIYVLKTDSIGEVEKYDIDFRLNGKRY